MEGTESTHNTKVSDSAYSNSCSNSQSQRSGSSKSRQSGMLNVVFTLFKKYTSIFEMLMITGSNSSGSSGYGGKATETAR